MLLLQGENVLAKYSEESILVNNGVVVAAKFLAGCHVMVGVFVISELNTFAEPDYLLCDIFIIGSRLMDHGDVKAHVHNLAYTVPFIVSADFTITRSVVAPTHRALYFTALLLLCDRSAKLTPTVAGKAFI